LPHVELQHIDAGIDGMSKRCRRILNLARRPPSMGNDERAGSADALTPDPFPVSNGRGEQTRGFGRALCAVGTCAARIRHAIA
jgi:hypothetical protein